MKSHFAGLLLLGLLNSCAPKPEKVVTLFEDLPSDSTGVDFKNDLTFDEKFNIFTYRNFYNTQ